jgi:hypothetical protein
VFFSNEDGFPTEITKNKKSNLVPTLRVRMPSWTLRVLFRAAWPGLQTTQSVEDGIPTEDRWNE